MTKRELNRDIKRLRSRFLGRSKENTTNWSNDQWDAYEKEEKEIREELLRLYRADKSFTSMNRDSILILLGINRVTRAIPLHMFGIQADL